MDAAEDAEEYVEDEEEVDVAEEEDTANITRTPWQENMHVFLQKQEYTPKSSGWHFLVINKNQWLKWRLLQYNWI